MPVIHVYAFERPLEKRRELMQRITDVTCEAYDVPPEIVTVYVFDVPKENAAHAGILASETEGDP